MLHLSLSDKMINIGQLVSNVVTELEIIGNDWDQLYPRDFSSSKGQTMGDKSMNIG